MKFIINGVLVELILNFDSNLAMAMCSHNVKPDSRFVSYADLMPEQFSVTESIIPNFQSDKTNLIKSFELTDLLLRVSKKIQEYTECKS